LRQSRYAGLLLFLLLTEDPYYKDRVSIQRIQWMQEFLTKLSIESLQQSYSFALRILHNPRIRNSLKKEIERELHSYRVRSRSESPEPRRIGVGYRDKGTLRPLHHKREIGKDSFWQEDLILWNYLPPNDREFVTTEEVLSPGINPDTILMISHQVRLMASFETLTEIPLRY
jgi:hypothetical protein